MLVFRTNTDQRSRSTLASSIAVVRWVKAIAGAQVVVALEVFTSFVGNNAEIEIELADKSGTKHGKFKDQISGNRFWAQVRVPPSAKDELYAMVKLPKHGLSMKSNPLVIVPPVQITNLKWGQKEARRGDIVKLSADVKGIPDGTEAKIEIWEHDNDGAHDLITTFTSVVKNAKIEAEWEYEYHEDTDEIPTEDEIKKYGKHYNPPEYFFVVDINGGRAGRNQESGLLRFKDWIEITVVNEEEVAMRGLDFTLTLADGSHSTGKLDADGKLKQADVPPGPILISFPKVT